MFGAEPHVHCMSILPQNVVQHSEFPFLGAELPTQVQALAVVDTVLQALGVVVNVCLKGEDTTCRGQHCKLSGVASAAAAASCALGHVWG
jgi:hypothetical protein